VGAVRVGRQVGQAHGFVTERDDFTAEQVFRIGFVVQAAPGPARREVNGHGEHRLPVAQAQQNVVLEHAVCELGPALRLYLDVYQDYLRPARVARADARDDVGLAAAAFRHVGKRFLVQKGHFAEVQLGGNVGIKKVEELA